MRREELEQQVAHWLAGMQADVVAGYLFGSVARGDDGPESDVDVALWLRSAPQPTVAGAAFAPILADDLTEALGRRADVVVLNGAPLELIHRVLRDGVLIAERDRSARIAFEVAFRRTYLDMQPYLRE